jgi:hypothetical protein
MNSGTSPIKITRRYYCTCRGVCVGKNELLSGPVTCEVCGDRFALSGTGYEQGWIDIYRALGESDE